jgi:hypothetical protein
LGWLAFFNLPLPSPRQGRAKVYSDRRRGYAQGNAAASDCLLLRVFDLNHLPKSAMKAADVR